MKSYDIVIVGGGPAGLAAAASAKENGIDSILILERDRELGGILNQCIHNGFGLHTFKEELTGPEYADRFIKLVENTNIEIKLDTMVLEIEEDKKIHVINTEDGYMILEAKSIILAMGCRERTRGAIGIPGDRPAGIFTAGAAQRYINIEGYMPGKEVVILGSGDIGLIMARRMTLEGAKVKAVVELMPYSNGLNRNIVQCLNDYDIPLYLSHTVTDIVGDKRLEKIVISKVDENKKPIKGSEIEFSCDTLLLSVGLIPENELSKKVGVSLDNRTNGLVVTENMETNIDGIFACGNVVHVHDLVDFVSEEAKRAGKAVAKYLNNSLEKKTYINIKNGNGINYTVPQNISVNDIDDKLTIFMRVNNVYKDMIIKVISGDNIIQSLKRKHLAPAEMERVVIKKELLKDLNEDIIISLEEVN